MYVENGVLCLGVVYVFVKGWLFYINVEGGLVEEKVFFNVMLGEVSLIGVNIMLDNCGLMVVVLKLYCDVVMDDYIGCYGVCDMILVGLLLKFCLVVIGEVDFYLCLGWMMEWDMVVGDVVLCGVGGEVVCFDDYSLLVYGKLGFENLFFIVFVFGVLLVKDWFYVGCYCYFGVLCFDLLFW